MRVGTIVHYFPGLSPQSWHYHAEKRHADCIAAIIARESSVWRMGEAELIADLAVFNRGVQAMGVPHHSDYLTHEYHDYDNGSWHSLDECVNPFAEQLPIN